MGWLHEHGVISCWQDFSELPPRVLEDARLVMVAEVHRQQRQSKKR